MCIGLMQGNHQFQTVEGGWRTKMVCLEINHYIWFSFAGFNSKICLENFPLLT